MSSNEVVNNSANKVSSRVWSWRVERMQLPNSRHESPAMGKRARADQTGKRNSRERTQGLVQQEEKESTTASDQSRSRPGRSGCIIERTLPLNSVIPHNASSRKFLVMKET